VAKGRNKYEKGKREEKGREAKKYNGKRVMRYNYEKANLGQRRVEVGVRR
jgi:hypothetical protein